MSTLTKPINQLVRRICHIPGNRYYLLDDATPEQNADWNYYYLIDGSTNQPATNLNQMGRLMGYLQLTNTDETPGAVVSVKLGENPAGGVNAASYQADDSGNFAASGTFVMWPLKFTRYGPQIALKFSVPADTYEVAIKATIAL